MSCRLPLLLMAGNIRNTTMNRPYNFDADNLSNCNNSFMKHNLVAFVKYFTCRSKLAVTYAQAKELMGELYDIYYENRDLRLLLDLLSATSGLAPPLR
jgi:hypothetical protein